MSSIDVESVEQKAGAISGSGKMTALAAEIINGNIYIQKISQVQMVCLSPEGRLANAERFIDVRTRPYKSLYPYTATDEALFQGRTKEIEIIKNRMTEQRLLVVYGQARVGKTSLLAAGVMPAVAREKEVFTLLLEDYSEPERTIHEELIAIAKAAAAQAEFAKAAVDKAESDAAKADLAKAAVVKAEFAKRFSFDFGQTSKFPLLLNSIIKQAEQPLLLVLDQFERLFEPTISSEQRDVFLNNLAEALRTIDEPNLRVIIVARSEALEKLGELKGPLQNLLQCPFQVMPLSIDEARRAIEDPIHTVRPETKTIYDGDIVNSHLLPDLDELSPGEPGFIYPQHLQIVCAQLYLSAYRKKGDSRIIDTELYVDELEGADSIMASFMRSMLNAQVHENQQGLAVRLLAIMAVPGAQRWMKPAEFDLKDAEPTAIEALLERLVKAKFLIQSYDGDVKKYALVSEMITTELRRLSGTGEEVDKRYNAEDELERVWHTWLSLENLASGKQVRYLAESGGHLKPRAVKTLLLLRSAVEQDEEAATWVERLRGTENENGNKEDREGKELIEQLEMPAKVAHEQRIGSTMLVKAKRLLGFRREKPPETNGEESLASSSPTAAQAAPFGPIAEKAVSAPSSAVRQTCALALAAIDPVIGVSRLDAALKTVSGRWRRRRLQVELRGALADADPQVEQLNSDLPLLQRILIWRWRASRRVARDKHRLAVLTLGGAVGAGLGVGLLRAIMAVPPVERPGVMFGIYFFYVGALGAALSYGAALAEPLHLIRTKRADDSITESNSWRAQLRATLLIVVLGTTFFGLLHSVLVWLNGLSFADGKAYRVISMGFVAGLGLSIALTFHLRAWRLNILNWLLSWSVASLILVFVHWYFEYAKARRSDDPMEILFTSSRDYLRFISISQEANPTVTPTWWLALFKDPSGTFSSLAVLYAIITGIALITGLSLGMWWANKSLQKGRRMPHHASASKGDGDE